MNRRELVKAISSGVTLIAVGGLSIVACHDDSYKPVFFESETYEFLSNLSDYILPDCDESPGAKKAGVAAFLDRFIPICKSEVFQSDIKVAIEKLRNLSENDFGKAFHKLSKEKQKEQMHNFEALNDNGYSALKSLIVFAYFTSKDGMTKALSYVAVPQKFDGEVIYENNDKAWAL